MIVSCSKSNDIEPENVLSIHFDTDSTYLVTDATQVEIEVSSNLNEIDAENRLINFTSNAGTFSPSEVTLKKINGKFAITTSFKPNQKPTESAWVTATVKNKSDVTVTEYIKLDTPVINDILSFSVSRNTVKANGIDTITCHVKIQNILAKNITISSNNTDAKFIKSLESSISYHLKPNKTESFIVVTSKNVGTFILTATIDDKIKSAINYEQVRVSPDDILELELNGNNPIILDNTTIYEGSVQLKDYALENIVISVNHGEFVSASSTGKNSITLLPDNSGNVAFHYKPTNSIDEVLMETKIVSAGVITIALNITPAYPESIILIPDSYEIGSMGSMSIDAFFLRNTGLVTTGLSVSVEATQTYDESTHHVGRFVSDVLPIVTKNGKNTVSFKLDTRPAKEGIPIRITVSVIDGNNNKITGNCELQIK